MTGVAFKGPPPFPFHDSPNPSNPLTQDITMAAAITSSLAKSVAVLAASAAVPTPRTPFTQPFPEREHHHERPHH